MAVTALSVLVSTHDRAEDLARFLDAIAASRFRNETHWELVVVANACTDSTEHIVKQFIATTELDTVLIREHTKGKSRALNTGLSHLRGNIVVFTDDDVIPPKEWLQEILDHFESHPDCTAVGGMVELHNPADLPLTINLDTTPSRITEANFTPDNSPLMGCNMAVRRSAISAIGGFDERLGPGTRSRSAEDLDFLYRLIRHGYILDYAPQVRVAHNHGRQSADERHVLHDAYAFGRGYFYAKHIVRRDRQVARWAYWEVLSCLRCLLRLADDELGRREIRNGLKLATGALSYFRGRWLTGHWIGSRR